MPTVEVVIKTINQGDQETKRAVGSLTELNSAISLVRQGLEVAQKVYDATAAETLKYDSAVRQLAQTSGTGAEEASKLIQVLDDFKITADDLTTATRAMTRQGLSPTLDTLAQLSDQYNRLNPGQERADFLMQNFGKTGLKFAEAMSKGGDALKELGTEVNASLIRTDAQIARTRLAELAMDNWADSIQGLKVQIGTGLLGMIDGSTVAIQKSAQEIFKAAEGYEFNANAAGRYTEAQRAAWEEAKRMAEEQYLLSQGVDLATEKIDEQTISLQEQEQAIKLQSEQNEQFLGVLGQVDTAMDAYREGLAEANLALDKGQISTREHKAQVAELAAAYEAARQQIVFSIVEMRLATDGWTDSEVEAYLQIGEQLGQFSSDTANAARGALKEADKLVAGFDESTQQMEHVSGRATDAAGGLNTLKDSASSMSDTLRSEAIPALQELKSGANSLPPDGTSWTYYVNVISRGGFPKMPNHGESNLNAGVGYQSGQDVGPGSMGGGFSNYGTINIFANTPDEFLAMVGSEV